MKKILALAVIAGALSSCAVSIDVGTTKPNATGASVASRFVNQSNGNEYYICGNRNEDVYVSATYSGTYSSYTITLVGELNNKPGDATLSYGPFTFNADNDLSGSIIRRLAITTNDIKPSEAGTVKPLAVIVTPAPAPIPPQTGNALGIGAFRAQVTFTNSAGSSTVVSGNLVRVLGNNNAQCPAN